MMTHEAQEDRVMEGYRPPLTKTRRAVLQYVAAYPESETWEVAQGAIVGLDQTLTTLKVLIHAGWATRERPHWSFGAGQSKWAVTEEGIERLKRQPGKRKRASR